MSASGNSTLGILAHGAYLPRRRLQRAAIYAANAWFAPGLKGLARGERTVANWDEDAVTMAVEAARDALQGCDRSSVVGLSLASTTLPFADRLNAGIVKEALRLADEVHASDQGGSQRAGTSALLHALRSAQALPGPQLCIGTDLRKARPASEAELMQGDGAAALLVGNGAPIARFVDAYTTTHDFIDHFRSTKADFDYTWESRWIRDEGHTGLVGAALKAALAQFGISGADIHHFLLPITARGVAESLAKQCGIAATAIGDNLAANVGETGVAHPLLMLVQALESAQPGQKLLLVGFGQGVDVLLFETTAALANLPPRRGVQGSLALRRQDDNYLRWLFHRGLLDLERGMRAESDEKQPGSTLWRQRKAVLGLVGGRCTKTGTVQFPKTDISVSTNDHGVGTQEDYPLADIPARIVTYTADSLTYSAAPPNYFGTIDFEGGGRLMAEFTDVDPADVEVGRKVAMAFRIKAIDDQRDFVKYFWKAVPIDG